MNDLLLEIKDLGIHAGKNRITEHVSLELKRSTITGLVGESGSGKTITALSVLGLLPPGVNATSGTIMFHDHDGSHDLLTASTKTLNNIRGNRISMIFQEPMTSLNPSMRCGKQAMEPLLKLKKYNRAETREKILDLFREVKLPDVEKIFNAWPHELSGGQRQRVMIAMALATSPGLLIADEPTTALDVTVQKNLLKLLLELRDKFDLSILFITHDLLVLKQIADEVSVMYGGRIVESGTMDQVLENPETPYAKGLLACRPGLDNQPIRLLTIEDFMENSAKLSKTEPLPSRPPSGEVLLTVKDLNVRFKSKGRPVNAVRDVSFDLFRGETLGLVGESGCGKTTLGRSILQLINIDNGSVIYRGRPLNQMNNRELRQVRRKIQIVFQDPYSSLNPGMTIGNTLMEPMMIHGLAKGKRQAAAQVIHLLERVEMPADILNLYPHQFSGGQRQRIGIARALACQPEFIVLDESVSALDVSVQARILNLLNDLKQEFQLTYIFISHDLTVVKYMSDRVMVMSEGEIIETGTSEQIYLHPSNPYTRQLIESIPV
ncbi:MAG: ABC transporter ATP-binding protein [Bacteroidales bacterium]